MTSITHVVAPTPGMGLVLAIASDGDHVVAVGGQGRDLFLSSIDGGRSFDRRLSPGNGLRGAHVDGDQIWVCGEWGYLSYSPDRGHNWERLHVTDQGCLFGIVADRDGTLWVGGDDGILGRSTDGRHFELVEGIEEGIARLTPSRLGVLIPTDEPGHLYLADGDAVRQLDLEAGCDLMKARVLPTGTLMVVGDDGTVLRSTDDGASFDRVEGEFRGLLCSVAAPTELPDGQVVIVGEGGQIWSSFDDGWSFSRLRQNLSADALWCCERVHDTLLVGGHRGAVLQIGESRRTPTSLPPLPGRTADVPDNPQWRAPAASEATQSWSPPTIQTVEKHRGIDFSPMLRSMLLPRRGGFQRPIRPLPPAEVAWARLRRALWANAEKRCQETEEPHEIWRLVTAFEQPDREFGERLLATDPHPIDRGQAEDALRRTLHLARPIGYPNTLSESSTIREEAYRRVVDFVAANLGLAETARVLLEGVQTGEDTAAISMGRRLRELLVAADADVYQQARVAILNTVRERRRALGDVPDARFVGWLGTHLLPLGPAAGREERELHDAMLDELVPLPDSKIQICGLASGDAETLRRFIEVHENPSHMLLGPFSDNIYAISVLELEGAGCADLVVQMKPGDRHADNPLFHGFWINLLAHIHSDVALDALLREHRNGKQWGLVGLREASRLDEVRVRAFLRSHGAAEVIEEVEKDRRTPLTAPPPPLEDAMLLQGDDRPTPYAPTERVALPLEMFEDAPATRFDLRLDDGFQSYEEPVWTWNGLPLAECSRDELDDFVEHMARWEIPTNPEMLAAAPAEIRPSLLRQGLSTGWMDWGYLSHLVQQEDDAVVPALSHALEVTALDHSARRSRAERGERNARYATEWDVLFSMALAVGDVRLVPPILDAFADPDRKTRAACWLLHHPVHAAAAVVQTLGDEPGNQAAGRALRFLAVQGHRQLIEETATARNLGVVVDEWLEPAAWTESRTRSVEQLAEQGLTRTQSVDLPNWAERAAGKLRSGDGLSRDPAAATRELEHLALSTALEPLPAVLTAHKRWTPESLRACARTLVDEWCRRNSPHNHAWALLGLTFWGDDLDAQRLGIHAAASREDHNLRLALLDVQALGAIDGTVPGTELAHLAFGARRHGDLVDETWSQLRLHAARRGTEVGELLEHLEPIEVPDADSAARDQVRLRQRRLAEEVLITRLEAAMVEQREFSGTQFRDLFFAGTLRPEIARGIVWSTDDVETTFRICDDGTLADEDDLPIAIDEHASVRIPHPVQLDDDVVSAWTTIFSDYELTQPFPQLERAVFRPVGERPADHALPIPEGGFEVRRFESLFAAGWQPTDDPYWNAEIYRRFPSGHVAVALLDPGWPPDDEEEELPPQTVEVFLYPPPGEHPDDEPAPPFDPIVYSEVLGQISAASRN